MTASLKICSLRVTPRQLRSRELSSVVSHSPALAQARRAREEEADNQFRSGVGRAALKIHCSKFVRAVSKFAVEILLEL